MNAQGRATSGPLGRRLYLLLCAVVAIGWIGCGDPGGDSDAPGVAPGPTDQAGTTEPGASGEAVVPGEADNCSCGDAVCGLDNCGESCGSCPDDSYCIAGQCETEESCPLYEFVSGYEFEFAKTTIQPDSLSLYYENVLNSFDFNLIRILANTTPDTSIGPGTYNLEDFDPETCELCVHALNGCSSNGCNESWVATGGWIELDTALDGETFAGRLRDVWFAEATVDDEGKVTYLEEGRDRCTSAYEFDVETQIDLIDPGACDPEGTGRAVEDQIGDLTLMNCLGEEVHLHQHCDKRAVWLVGAAGW